METFTTSEPGQFEKCVEPGCVEDATFITLVGKDLVCYCDAHGVAHDLDRGIPIAATVALKPNEPRYPNRPVDEPYHSA